jgi:shikimate dehydrogenase
MVDYAISGKTRICALIGDPVAHSMSPAMHNAAYRKMGLDYIYLALPVKSADLKAAVEGLRALNFRGFNVTMPHKVAIIPLLDGLDPLAEKIGAVNTVVNECGELRGYNTDGPGFLQALLEHGVEPQGKNIVVLGAGGASRAISYVLAQRGARLTILNRKLEMDWAEDIAAFLREDLGAEAAAVELDGERLQAALAGADVLINATSVGMDPASDKSLVPAELLRAGLMVCDVIYSPLQTRLIREARAAGCRTVGGVDMLAWQGVLCFEKWTGQPVPPEMMRQEAVRMLERHED